MQAVHNLGNSFLATWLCFESRWRAASLFILFLSAFIFVRQTHCKLSDLSIAVLRTVSISNCMFWLVWAILAFIYKKICVYQRYFCYLQGEPGQPGAFGLPGPAGPKVSFPFLLYMGDIFFSLTFYVYIAWITPCWWHLIFSLVNEKTQNALFHQGSAKTSAIRQSM